MTGLAAELDLRVDERGHLREAVLADSARAPELNAGLLAAVHLADSLGELIPASTHGSPVTRLELTAGLQLPADGAAIMRVALPFWTITTPAAVRHAPQPDYPRNAQRAGIESDVELQFIVAEDGRPIPSSLRVVEAEYREFIESAVRTILHADFEPARSGTCRVKQLVRERVRYRLQR